jgi:3-oxoisoapionate kinase
MTPLVAWLGDDFTGSAAVMEVLTFAGLPSVLFLQAPDAAMLTRFPGVQGIGIATDARAQGPDWMDRHLPPLFAALRATGARLIHYKVCSTFDSAPHVGSIGRAMDLGLPPDGWAALVIPSPRIGRWQAFGTLFARAPGGIARLDRHPTMVRHPVTPMDEADIRRHLARQTALSVGLVDVTDLAADPAAALTRERDTHRAVAFDLITEAHLAQIGGLLLADPPTLAIGSQGVEDALVAHLAQPAPPVPRPGPAQVLLVSGSCAPDTARQIDAAGQAGFAVIRLDPTAGPDAAKTLAASALDAGNSVIVHSALGPDDPAIARARQAGISGARIGQMLGHTLAGLARPGLRLAVAGGDTSGAATQALDVQALTATALFAPSVPLMTAHRADGTTLPLILKGGQMGPPDLFIRLRGGVR